MGSIRAPRSHRVHLGSRGFTWARLVVGRFIRVGLDSLGRALLSPGSLAIAWAHSGAHKGRRVNSGLRGFTRARVVFAAFLRVCVCSFGRA